MRSQIIFCSAVVLFAAFMLACGGPAPANSNSAPANAANAVKANTNNPLETTKAPAEQTVNDAPTLAPVFKAYCAAIKGKNEAAIRKVYSQDTIRFFEDQMKKDKVPTLLKYLENDKVEKTCEARNEQITGDKGVAEVKADSYPNGIKVVFVKENGEWKMTNKSPEIDNMKSSSKANSAAK